MCGLDNDLGGFNSVSRHHEEEASPSGLGSPGGAQSPHPELVPKENQHTNAGSLSLKCWYAS